jgi:hypothetical protein
MDHQDICFHGAVCRRARSPHKSRACTCARDEASPDECERGGGTKSTSADVHSHWAGQDAIICFLDNTLTPVERTLGPMDEHQRLHECP